MACTMVAANTWQDYIDPSDGLIPINANQGTCNTQHYEPTLIS